MAERQNRYLQYVAVAELAQQEERLATYRIQARYELATILDRAANPEAAPAPAPGVAAPTEAAPAPSTEPEQPAPEPSEATGTHP
jgi:hypothetical protein